jgi:hypothetical protein
MHLVKGPVVAAVDHHRVPDPFSRCVKSFPVRTHLPKTTDPHTPRDQHTPCRVSPPGLFLLRCWRRRNAAVSIMHPGNKIGDIQSSRRNLASLVDAHHVILPSSLKTTSSTTTAETTTTILTMMPLATMTTTIMIGIDRTDLMLTIHDDRPERSDSTLNCYVVAVTYHDGGPQQRRRHYRRMGLAD